MRRLLLAAGIALASRLAILAIIAGPDLAPPAKAVREFREGDVVDVNRAENTVTLLTGVGTHEREARIRVVDGFSRVRFQGAPLSSREIRRGDFLVVRYDVPHASGMNGEAPLARDVRVSRSRTSR